MATQGPETMIEAEHTITRGTGNVFADLGYADADQRQTKLRLAHAINGVIGRRRLSQTVAAGRLGVNQPKVSALANYKLEGFSVEGLMIFLMALDQVVYSSTPTRSSQVACWSHHKPPGSLHAPR